MKRLICVFLFAAWTMATLSECSGVGDPVTTSATEGTAPVDSETISTAPLSKTEKAQPENHGWHPHDEKWPLTPGEAVDLDIEMVPTGTVISKGYRLAFTIRSKDYEYIW